MPRYDSISDSFPSAEAVVATVRTSTSTNTNTCTRLYAKKGGGDDDVDTVVALLYSHHLLDHKPDNLILKGGRHKLRGVACLGRPGVALCIGSQRSISKFRASLESAMPQKRFKTKILLSNKKNNNKNNNSHQEECAARFDGFEQATLGEFREHLASFGEEAEFFALTGIAPETAAAVNGRNNCGVGEEIKVDGGKQKKKSKKRKRKS